MVAEGASGGEECLDDSGEGVGGGSGTRFAHIAQSSSLVGACFDERRDAGPSKGTSCSGDGLVDRSGGLMRWSCPSKNIFSGEGASSRMDLGFDDCSGCFAF